MGRILLATKLGLVVSAHEAPLRECFSNRLGFLATKLGLVVSAHEAPLRECFSNRLGLLIQQGLDFESAGFRSSTQPTWEFCGSRFATLTRTFRST